MRSRGAGATRTRYFSLNPLLSLISCDDTKTEKNAHGNNCIHYLPQNTTTLPSNILFGLLEFLPIAKQFEI